MLVRPSHASLLFLALGACGDDAGPAADPIVTVSVIGLSSESTARATLDDLTIEVLEDGAPVPRLQLQLSAEAGGGAVTPKTLRTDDDGHAAFSWTLGSLPVANVLAIDSGTRGVFRASIDVPAAASMTPGSFGQVDGFMTAEQVAGSTEDLAFRGDGTLVMGMPGGLIKVGDDGGVSRLATTGVTPQRPLGLAFDQGGRLFIADADADQLLVMDRANVISTFASADGGEPFVAPNDVAVGPDGRVYLSDTCTGKVYGFTADGAIFARMSFDRATQGGPNGVVVGPDGALWVTTENVALFCDNAGVEATDNVAGLFRWPIEGSAFGAREEVATHVGLFGDGLAFDSGGNLYVLFDTVVDLQLDQTILYVLPAGGDTLRRVVSGKNKVWANPAFGRGTFGETTLYLALLAVPPFTSANARGLERVRVEVTGAPLPAAAP